MTTNSTEAHTPDRQNSTPMMRQYLEQKARHPDAVLLFRMGDFYEMFFEDAKKAARILDIALTTRDKNKEESVPMCGFPHHAASSYISRLLSAGERVAVCDQMEDPRTAKGIVHREVTRVLTPGLTEDSRSIKAEENHYVTALVSRGDLIGLAAFDLSTGDLLVTETDDATLAGQELRRLDPKEVLVPEALPETNPLSGLLDDTLYVHRVEDWMQDQRTCVETLLEQYDVRNLTGFGLNDTSPMTAAAGIIVSYVKQTRPDAQSHIKPPRVYHLGNYMVLDQATLRNLEIFKNLRDGTANGTLVRLLDKTSTSMGARLLRRWIAYPLLDRTEIRERSGAVEKLMDDPVLRGELRRLLRDMGDMERIAGKISLKSALPRDLVLLRHSAEMLPSIVALLGKADGSILDRVREMDDLAYVAHAVASVLVDEPPVGMKDGGFVRSGYDEQLDELRGISRNGKQWIAGMEAREREKTGIPNLKVGFNKVFGYYIEVSKSRQGSVPENYVRKQTLVNAERYVTEDLKEYELKVLNAQERILELEAEIFQRLRAKLLEVIARIQQTASTVAMLDVLLSLAEIAHQRGYVRPGVEVSDEIRIVAGRHPVVETFDLRETFVPNDVVLNRSSDQILVITGPNMAGKSTYLRMTALLVLMAQMGGMVPAQSASIGLADRIFTRIGAADYLAFGQSTFMVEMNETADILHNATERSLVLLDEVGRGTSTFDGLSIAWAVTEYLHDRPDGGPRTLFATHYHELVEIAQYKHRVQNYNIAVREFDNKVVFLRKILPGGCSRSYGIQVAKLAGIPDKVIDRADELLANLEHKQLDPRSKPDVPRKTARKKAMDSGQGNLFGNPSGEVIEELRGLDLNGLTPLDALNVLAKWRKKLESLPGDPQ